MIGHNVLLRAVLITLALASWLALIFWPREPQRREDREWHGRNTITAPPPLPVLGTHPDMPPAADAPVR